MRRPLLTALALALLLSGCTDDGGGERRAGREGAAGSASPGVPASERLLAETDGGGTRTEPVATVEGDLPLLGSSRSRVRVDVLEVRAGEETTLLRWRLSSATDEEVDTYSSALSRPIGFDTRQVALLGPDSRLQPFTFVRDGQDSDLGCVCSSIPGTVGPQGRTLFALYPALEPGTAEVDVVLPGVAELTGVPVSR